MRDYAERPATLVPPPLIYALSFFGSWELDQRLALRLDFGAAAQYGGWALIALGLFGFGWSLATIWGQRTTVNPFKGATRLVTNGPFRYSRNPIYVSDWLVYAGSTLLLKSAWPLVFAPLVWLVMRYFVIAHEEAHLAAKFEDAYRGYQSRVRRWL